MPTPEEQTGVRAALEKLRQAVVFEKEEKAKAHFEAKQEADQRIKDAHLSTAQLTHVAHALGATKTAIAERLGIKNLNRVGQLIDEGKTSITMTEGENA